MTKGGVERDLPRSPYTHKLNNLTFYFSSKIYKEKFVTALANYTHDFRLTLEKKLSISVIGCEDIASILLYKRTEKRGFYIEYIRLNAWNDREYFQWNNIEQMFLDLGYAQICKKGIERCD